MAIGQRTLLAMVAIAGMPVLAQAEVDDAYLKGLATYIDPDSDRAVDSEVAGGAFGFGLRLSERFNAEFDVQALDLSGESGAPDQEQTALGVNLMNIYNRGGRFSPFLLLGAGVVSTDIDGAAGSDEDLQIQGGAGLLTRLGSDRVALRAEALYRWQDDPPDSLGDWLVNVGVQVGLGKRPPPPVPAAVAEVDSDGDGVLDGADQCPGTPRGASVDARGCPLDSDGDGVYDGLDQCPGTPKGAVVDARGCPLDGDGDGVYDGIDKCPTTPKGARVGELGCSVQLTLRGLSFAFDSATLLPVGEEVLREAVVAMREDPTITVEIQGHTDSRGPAEYNLVLGERRASSVRDFLVAEGIGAERLQVRSYGETEPVADNETEEGRAANRRVVLKALTFSDPRQ